MVQSTCSLRGSSALCFLLLSTTLLASHSAAVQPVERVAGEVNNGARTRLPGNVHPLAQAQYDQGPAPADLPMSRMVLVLTRSAAQQAELQTLLKNQQDPNSPQYHQWLTPQQFGEQFGAADADIQKITSWLESQGFTIDHVGNGKTFIQFSGTAAQVEQAFHTQIHQYVVNGVPHWANATNPEIPAALAPVVAGVATLYNFSKHPQLVKSADVFNALAGKKPQFSSSGTYALAPADFATIYNIKPLYQAGINGAGATIAVVGRTNINVSDITSFRSIFGLATNPPQIIVNGTDPGDLGGSEEAEAVLDTTWAGAVAPNATVDLVVSASTNTTDGVDLSEMYIIDHNLGDIMTESFGDCEADYTAAEAAAYSALAEQAASQGQTYTVAAGDSGAEGCDDPTEFRASGPMSVNILSSTPYDVAVGGTMFNENGNNSAYWDSTNGTNGESALSYIPENVWNESCTPQQCGRENAGLWAGGGGVSTLFPKPSWQAGVTGIPNDHARDVPDVALTAAGHDAYLLCLDGSCTPATNGTITFDGYSGTSAATPSFAGIMALLKQKLGYRLGLPNPTLYSLAAREDLAACNASNTSILPASNCVFNDVTSGNNAVPGEASYGTANPLYPSTTGYDLATGLGSVNVTNLVYAFAGETPPAPGTVSSLIGITQPASDNSVVTGIATFTGWALLQKASISSVTVLVDGSPVGTATYGISRTDICSTFANYAGCPNVGWSFNFDTTTIADGSHTLEVTASSSGAQDLSTSTTFTVANWSTANPMTIDIDVPAANGPVLSGTVGLGGWTLDSLAAISQVSISIDGAPFGLAQYGGTRGDVCAIYANAPGCPKVGWNYTLDTTLLANGTHTLSVTPTTSGGQASTASQTFQVNNSANNPITLDIDVPASSSNPSFSGPAVFSGWAIDNNSAITSVAIAIDGVSFGNVTYGGVRTDVCTVFSGRPGCPNVGWSFLLDTTRLPNGTHTLEITAYGSTHATASRQFTVSNTTPGNPVTADIDVPGSLNSVIQGVVQLRGWAVSSNAAISSVSLAVDGRPAAVANYGTARPDVCAVYTSAVGCPNVGWQINYDSSLLPNGQHTLVATATVSSNGTTTEQGSASVTFTVANWRTSNPMTVSIDVPSSSGGPYSGNIGFGGWATDTLAAIGSVSITIDGASYGNASYGGVRTDVCAIFTSAQGCPNVGWNFGLNTAALENGTHTLEVTATSVSGQSTTTSTTFQVSNTGDTVIVDVDNPSPNGLLTGTAQLGGWALDTSGATIQQIQLLVDGYAYGAATLGLRRADACAMFPSAGGCPNVGWAFSLNTTQFANGIHTLEVRATAADGTEGTTSQLFEVGNSQ